MIQQFHEWRLQDTIVAFASQKKQGSSGPDGTAISRCTRESDAGLPRGHVDTRETAVKSEKEAKRLEKGDARRRNVDACEDKKEERSHEEGR